MVFEQSPRRPPSASSPLRVPPPPVIGVATSSDQLGTSHYARRMNHELGIFTLPSEGSGRELLRAVAQSQARICHVQFEYQAFGTPLQTFVRFPRLVTRIGRGAKVIVTLHGVVTPESVSGWRGRLSFWMYRFMLRRAARATTRWIVLSERMRVELARLYDIQNVSVVPMGCDEVPVPTTERRSRYLLFFGFLRRSKGIIELIEAFATLGIEFPDLELVIAGGSAKGREPDFPAELERMIVRHPFRSRIRLYKGFLPTSRRNELASEATVIVLPYRDRFVEISAVAHDVAGSGTPLVCAANARFEEFVEGVEALHAVPEPSSLAESIRRILVDEDLRTKLSEGIRSLASRESWPNIARLHRDLYREVLEFQNDVNTDLDTAPVRDPRQL